VDRTTVTDELVFGLVFLVAAGLVFAFRRTVTRWMAGYYGRIADAAPWLYPGPLRKTVEEPFLRWVTIALGLMFLAVSVAFFVVAVRRAL
jgi:hypothetical protein